MFFHLLLVLSQSKFYCFEEDKSLNKCEGKNLTILNEINDIYQNYENESSLLIIGFQNKEVPLSHAFFDNKTLLITGYNCKVKLLNFSNDSRPSFSFTDVKINLDVDESLDTVYFRRFDLYNSKVTINKDIKLVSNKVVGSNAALQVFKYINTDEIELYVHDRNLLSNTKTEISPINKALKTKVSGFANVNYILLHKNIMQVICMNSNSAFFFNFKEISYPLISADLFLSSIFLDGSFESETISNPTFFMYNKSTLNTLDFYRDPSCSTNILVCLYDSGFTARPQLHLPIRLILFGNSTITLFGQYTELMSIAAKDANVNVVCKPGAICSLVLFSCSEKASIYSTNEFNVISSSADLMQNQTFIGNNISLYIKNKLDIANGDIYLTKSFIFSDVRIRYNFNITKNVTLHINKANSDIVYLTILSPIGGFPEEEHQKHKMDNYYLYCAKTDICKNITFDVSQDHELFNFKPVCQNVRNEYCYGVYYEESPRVIDLKICVFDSNPKLCEDYIFTFDSNNFSSWVDIPTEYTEKIKFDFPEENYSYQLFLDFSQISKEIRNLNVSIVNKNSNKIIINSNPGTLDPIEELKITGENIFFISNTDLLMPIKRIAFEKSSSFEISYEGKCDFSAVDFIEIYFNFIHKVANLNVKEIQINVCGNECFIAFNKDFVLMNQTPISYNIVSKSKFNFLSTCAKISLDIMEKGLKNLPDLYIIPNRMTVVLNISSNFSNYEGFMPVSLNNIDFIHIKSQATVLPVKLNRVKNIMIDSPDVNEYHLQNQHFGDSISTSIKKTSEGKQVVYIDNLTVTGKHFIKTQYTDPQYIIIKKISFTDNKPIIIYNSKVEGNIDLVPTKQLTINGTDLSETTIRMNSDPDNGSSKIVIKDECVQDCIPKSVEYNFVSDKFSENSTTKFEIVLSSEQKCLNEWMKRITLKQKKVTFNGIEKEVKVTLEKDALFVVLQDPVYAHLTDAVIIGISIASVTFFLGILFFIVVYCKKKKLSRERLVSMESVLL